MNIFFMGQIKNLSNEFYELFKDTTVTKKAVDKLYFEINPIQSLKKHTKTLKLKFLIYQIEVLMPKKSKYRICFSD